jgi:hypothetical protein
MVIGLPFPRGRKERGAGVFEEDLSTVIFDSYDDQRLMGTLVGHSRRRERVFDTTHFTRLPQGRYVWPYRMKR